MFYELKSVFILLLLTLCLENSEGGLSVQSVTGFGNEETTITCQEPHIEPGDAYTWLKDSSSIYSYSVQGTLQSNKYNGTAQHGKIMLNLINTNVTDAGEYKCNHNFIDATGRLTVVFKASDIKDIEVSGNETNLNLTALAVYPSNSTIDRVECSKPDSASRIFKGTQTTSCNTTYQYLYDIKWVGWSEASEALIGECKCDVFIHTATVKYSKTINVTFVGDKLNVNSRGHEHEQLMVIAISITAVTAIILTVLIAYFWSRKKRSTGKRHLTVQTEGSGSTIRSKGPGRIITREGSGNKFISVDGNNAGETHPCFDTEPCHSDPLLEQEPQKEQTMNGESPNERALISFDGKWTHIFLTDGSERTITSEVSERTITREGSRTKIIRS